MNNQEPERTLEDADKEIKYLKQLVAQLQEAT
jgi:hypothetical protein